MPQKGLAPILIILLIAAAIGGFLIYSGKISLKQQTSTQYSNQTNQTSSKDETANWKTYTNETYKYSLSYPSNLKTQANTAGAGIKEAIPESVSYSIYDPNIKPDNSHSQNYVSVDRMDLVSIDLNNPNLYRKSYVMVGNVQAVKYASLKSGENFDAIYIAIPQSTGAIVFNISKDPQKAKVIDQILSTFKFLDQNNNKDMVGNVRGKLCYPSSFLPKGKIVAKSLVTGKTYSRDYPGSQAGGSSYSFDLPAGKYNLRYEISDNVYGYHSTVCPTGNETSCGDKNPRVLISADITSGQDVQNFDLCDFYYQPQNTPQF